MELIVNGMRVEVEPQPGEMLAHLLREQLGLTGTKIGCEEAECGACTVLVDGEPVLSCTYPAARAAGKSVLTIEGLKGMHPLQEEFIRHGAVQCGFCIPGQIMTAYALLQNQPNPSETEIRQALKDTLCRCAGYPSIIRAVQSAARRLRGETPLPPVVAPVIGEQGKLQPPLQVVGTLQPRPDALEKVSGTAKFTDDLKFPGMLHARVKRAMVPHAILKRLDVEKARVLPGVQAVLTAADIPGEKNHGLVIFDWPIMVGIGERVRYVGDAVAIVAAETRQIATQALDLIEAEYELLEVISDPVRARQPDAPQLHPNGNLLDRKSVV